MLRFFSSTGEQGTGKVGIPETSQAAPSQLLRESIVTRYAEAMFDALIRNSLDDIFNYRCCFCSHHSFLKLSKTDISENPEDSCARTFWRIADQS